MVGGGWAHTCQVGLWVPVSETAFEFLTCVLCVWLTRCRRDVGATARFRISGGPHWSHKKAGRSLRSKIRSPLFESTSGTGAHLRSRVHCMAH
jgi:hypothetical protein